VGVDVDVRVVDGELVGQTRQHIMMLSELAMLGCVTGVVSSCVVVGRMRLSWGR